MIFLVLIDFESEFASLMILFSFLVLTPEFKLLEISLSSVIIIISGELESAIISLFFYYLQFFQQLLTLPKLVQNYL